MTDGGEGKPRFARCRYQGQKSTDSLRDCLGHWHPRFDDDAKNTWRVCINAAQNVDALLGRELDQRLLIILEAP